MPTFYVNKERVVSDAAGAGFTLAIFDAGALPQKTSEPGVPPIANALTAATGKRLRVLPLSLSA